MEHIRIISLNFFPDCLQINETEGVITNSTHIPYGNNITVECAENYTLNKTIPKEKFFVQCLENGIWSTDLSGYCLKGKTNLYLFRTSPFSFTITE